MTTNRARVCLRHKISEVDLNPVHSSRLIRR